VYKRQCVQYAMPSKGIHLQDRGFIRLHEHHMHAVLFKERKGEVQ